ncbi:hypothetical protein [Streptomyces syringium]|uniref:hypothetical protein n=1 Tax=Streptomyces syringium TaxID=76729 RepID=UPI003452BAE5
MTVPRIALVGPVASGKSTLAAAIADHTGLPRCSLDDLFWGPQWTPAEGTAFHTAVRNALAAKTWIADGNYGGPVAQTLLQRADLAIWLDFSLRICLPRLVNRSVRRAISGQELFGGNRETFGHLVARDSILWWAPAHHHRHRRRWQASLQAAAADGLAVLRLDHPTNVAPPLRALGLLAPKESS